MSTPATHLSDEEIARYRGRMMPPVALLAADDHLALCDICYGRVSEAQRPDDKLFAASKAFDAAAAGHVTHLTYEQMAALVDNQVDDIDREIVQSHLELCRRCEVELKDLRELSSELARPRIASPEPGRSSSLRGKLISFWRLPALRIPALAAAGLVILVLAALVINILRRSDNAGPRETVAEREERNGEPTRREAAAVEKAPREITVGPEENDPSRQATEVPAEMRAALNDGDSRIALDSQGNLSGVRTDPGDERSIKNALLHGVVNLPSSLGELRGQSGTLMGDAGARFSLLEPVGIVIESDRPVLRWSALEDTESYTVTVYDSNLNQVASSDQLTTNQWAVPMPLPRGHTYIWQVRAIKNGAEVIAPPPVGSRVKFRVLEQAKVEAIERAKRSKSHLVMGVIYAEAGLLDDAELEFAALVRDNPNSEAARKLLRGVKAAKSERSTK
jgi:hypothetical protein